MTTGRRQFRISQQGEGLITLVLFITINFSSFGQEKKSEDPSSRKIAQQSAAKLAQSFTQDTDNDGVVDAFDNCPTKANANQLDTDKDGIGDVCDSSQYPWYASPDQIHCHPLSHEKVTSLPTPLFSFLCLLRGKGNSQNTRGASLVKVEWSPRLHLYPRIDRLRQAKSSRWKFALSRTQHSAAGHYQVLHHLRGSRLVWRVWQLGIRRNQLWQNKTYRQQASFPSRYLLHQEWTGADIGIFCSHPSRSKSRCTHGELWN